jgi:hypothetical protein
LKYHYYKGEWSQLPFNKVVAVSDIVAETTPKHPSGSDE